MISGAGRTRNSWTANSEVAWPRALPLFPWRRARSLHQRGQGADVAGRGAAAAADDGRPIAVRRKRACWRAKGAGSRSYTYLPARNFGSPALGMTASGNGEAAARSRTASRISSGPVPQLTPKANSGEGQEGGQRRGDVGSQQHAVLFQGDQQADRPGAAPLPEGPVQGAQRRLCLQHVLAGLHLEQVDAAVQQPQRLGVVGVLQGQ